MASESSAPIVVGYDGSRASQAALDRAIEEAAASGGSLVVVSVAAMPLDVEGPMSFGVVDAPATSVPLEAPPQVDEALSAAREQIESAGIDADYVWSTGDPAPAILREARERDADVIVVGKGHHGRLARWLGIDVAAEVEQAAGCRMIVVEP